MIELPLAAELFPEAATPKPAENEPTFVDLVTANYVNPPIPPSQESPERPAATRTLAARDTTLNQLAQTVPETPAERAKREWDDFQVWRLNNLGEPGNALGPGRASACSTPYDPFWETR